MTYTTITDLTDHIESLMGQEGDRESAEIMARMAWDEGVRDDDALGDLWSDAAFNAIWCSVAGELEAGR